MTRLTPARSVTPLVALLGLALVNCRAADMPTPPPPTGAVRVDDWGALDQARAEQLRRGLAELERRLHGGRVCAWQLWRLPAGAGWAAVLSRYTAAPGWQADGGRRADAGPLTPPAQVLTHAATQAELTLALFAARAGLPGDGAVLAVGVPERAR